MLDTTGRPSHEIGCFDRQRDEVLEDAPYHARIVDQGEHAYGPVACLRSSSSHWAPGHHLNVSLQSEVQRKGKLIGIWVQLLRMPYNLMPVFPALRQRRERIALAQAR